MEKRSEKIMPRVRVRIKGQKLSKSAKRAMAFMGAGATTYKWMMLDAQQTYESNRKKTLLPKDKAE